MWSSHSKLSLGHQEFSTPVPHITSDQAQSSQVRNRVQNLVWGPWGLPHSKALWTNCSHSLTLAPTEIKPCPWSPLSMGSLNLHQALFSLCSLRGAVSACPSCISLYCFKKPSVLCPYTCEILLPSVLPVLQKASISSPQDSCFLYS